MINLGTQWKIRVKWAINIFDGKNMYIYIYKSSRRLTNNLIKRIIVVSSELDWLALVCCRKSLAEVNLDKRMIK